jgi:CheY-like chemotaxis protein
MFRTLNNKHPLILVIDDNSFQRKLFRLLSDQLGFDVEVCENCMQALDAVAQRRFDLIFVDIRMPCQDGFECTALLRKHDQRVGRHTPIIAVTADAAPADREKCIKRGMDDYLCKPFTLQELADKLSYWTQMSTASADPS